MKTDTAPARVEYRRSQQVIQIYQHCQQHDEISLDGPGAEKNNSHKKRKHEVKEIVNDLLHMNL